MNKQRIIKKISLLAIVAFLVLILDASVYSQTIYDSFSDGDFTTSPTFGGTTGTFTVVSDSDAAVGVIGSNTLRLAVPTATAGTEYLSSQVSNFGASQQWGAFIGRRGQAFTAANQQYLWLYANEANLTSVTVDGYRLRIGDNSGSDEIRLEYIVNGAVSAVVITSIGAITNEVTDVGFLVRVTRSSTGVFELFTSTLPNVSGTGAVATDIPNATNANISQGTGTENSLQPAANGYLGLAALHSTDTPARTAAEFDQISFSVASPTAAGVSISGRVLAPQRFGSSSALVTLTDVTGNSRTIHTGKLGGYRFSDLLAGETYVLTVSARGYNFVPQIVTANEDLTNVDFAPQQ